MGVWRRVVEEKGMGVLTGVGDETAVEFEGEERAV